MKNAPFQLATVIKSNNLSNIGKYVEIIERADFTDDPVGTVVDRFGVAWQRGTTETVWVVKSLSSKFYFDNGALNDGGRYTAFAYFADSDLAPLPDEEDCVEELPDYTNLKGDLQQKPFFLTLPKLTLKD